MLSTGSIVAGFVTVLVGYTSSVAIIFQAAESAGASAEQLSSWLVVLGLGMGVTCIGLSLRYKTPIVTAWSTPGAALLVNALVGVSMPHAVGAFMFSAALITLCGVTGWFERSMDKISLPIAAAMLAGILARFGMNAFQSLQSEFALVFIMLVAYLLMKRVVPRYAVIVSLIIGCGLAWSQGSMDFSTFEPKIAGPVFVKPAFELASIIGVGIPLFVVTMASQNVPGVAVLRASGYDTPISPLISWTGLTTLVLAPFGGYAFNLAAITAAICMGPDAHADPNKRYWASVCAGVFYLITGVFGATVAALFAAFPKELVLAIAGLALLATIAGALHTAMSDGQQREPALITFLITVSGVSLWEIDAAFWGLIGGSMALLILNWRRSA